MPILDTLFRPERPSRDVFLHEDDYCLVELLPAANWWWCLEEMSRIDDYAMRHEAEGGGWTPVEVSDFRPAPLGDLELDVNEFIAQLHTRLPVFDRVVVGYSDQREPVPDMVANGISPDGAVFAEFDPIGTVVAAWLSPHPRTFHETSELGSALADLAFRWDLVLADWQWSHLIRPTEPKALSGWLASRRSQFWGSSQLELWSQDAR